MNGILSCCDSCCDARAFHLQGDESDVRSLLIKSDHIRDSIRALSCLEARRQWQRLPRTYGASRGLICNDWKYTCRRPLLAWLPTAITATLACEALFLASFWPVADSTNDFNAMKVLAYSMVGISTLAFGMLGMSICCCVVGSTCCEDGSGICGCFFCKDSAESAGQYARIILAIAVASVMNAGFYGGLKNQEKIEQNHHMLITISAIFMGATAVALGALGLGFFCCCVAPACNTTYERMKQDIENQEIHVDGSRAGSMLCDCQWCVDPTCARCICC